MGARYNPEGPPPEPHPLSDPGYEYKDSSLEGNLLLIAFVALGVIALCLTLMLLGAAIYHHCWEVCSYWFTDTP